ncbi:MAG: VOC family protein [Chloroflexota bacterium]|nr:VOC family protein [Chloroflexia bacterium]MDQ3226716.1 VOC family protein [Chloroflexota bacterium]
MIQIDGLAEVVLNVRNAARAVAFYGDLLGLERISPLEQPGPIFFRAGQATDRIPSLVVLVPLSADAGEFAQPRTLHHLALTVRAETFEEARAALTAAGVEVRDGTHPVLAVRTMYVSDPDGNEVELIAPELAP